MIKNIRLDRPLAVIDLETTGVDTVNDRVVEISVLKILPWGGHMQHTRRCNPERPIPHEATAVHGIDDNDVADEPPFSEMATEFAAFLDDCDLCGFNILRFDLRMLLMEFMRSGVDFPLEGRRVVDVCRIYHAMEPRDLSAAYRHYCGRDHEGAHGAASDVQATLAILDAQVVRYDNIPSTIAGLHDHFRDPAAVDLGEMFTRDDDGVIIFAKGKYKGQALDEVAYRKPDYLEWMLRADFFQDTKRLAADALGRSRVIEGQAVIGPKIGRPVTPGRDGAYREARRGGSRP